MRSGLCNSFVAIGLALAMCSAAAQQSQAVPPQPAQTDGIKSLDAVVVTGSVSGPGLWNVYKDDEHDLWIMGTLSPLPASIEWDATNVREMIADAQEVLWTPGYAVNVEANLFQQAALGLGYLRAKKNPDGQSLKDVLPADVYARWIKAKAVYLRGNAGIEKRRPLVAAEELLDAAVKRARLSTKPIVYPALEETIKSNGVRSNYPQVKINVSNAAAKAALADVRRMQLDDVRCLEATLDAVETDIPRMVANANAWATGDVAAISFQALQRRNLLCADAMMNPEFSAKYGLPDINSSIAARWMQEAKRALASNRSTIAFVPMENLVGPDSYLDRLKAQGYTVTGP